MLYGCCYCLLYKLNDSSVVIALVTARMAPKHSATESEYRHSLCWLGPRVLRRGGCSDANERGKLQIAKNGPGVVTRGVKKSANFKKTIRYVRSRCDKPSKIYEKMPLGFNESSGDRL